jgi:hypothetical protein
LYRGINVKTAIIQGTISRLNLDLRNAHPFLFLIDNGAKNPEIKNTVGITKISIIILRIPARSLVEGSSTSQKEAQMPLLS